MNSEVIQSIKINTICLFINSNPDILDILLLLLVLFAIMLILLRCQLRNKKKKAKPFKGIENPQYIEKTKSDNIYSLKKIKSVDVKDTVNNQCYGNEITEPIYHDIPEQLKSNQRSVSYDRLEHNPIQKCIASPNYQVIEPMS